eukprot:COSAG02_NODE_21143_length_800_cov_1.156919_1_plen_173_part_01
MGTVSLYDPVSLTTEGALPKHKAPELPQLANHGGAEDRKKEVQGTDSEPGVEQVTALRKVIEQKDEEIALLKEKKDEEIALLKAQLEHLQDSNSHTCYLLVLLLDHLVDPQQVIRRHLFNPRLRVLFSFLTVRCARHSISPCTPTTITARSESHESRPAPVAEPHRFRFDLVS